MVLVNASCEFIKTDIGDSGWQSDGGAFAASKPAMDNDLYNLPKARVLLGTDKILLYVSARDEAFALKSTRSCINQ